MKPNELIKSHYGHADVERRLNTYQDKDCIVAYYKEKLTTIFIMKSTNKYFAFVYQHPDLYYGGYGYNLTNITIKKALEIMGNDIVIADKELFGNLNKFMIVQAL